MKKSMIKALILVLLLSPVCYSGEKTTRDEIIKTRIPKLTYKVITETLIKNRNEVEFPINSLAEIERALYFKLNNQNIADKEEIKQKIYQDIDLLFNCYWEYEGPQYQEITKRLTLYYVTLSLLYKMN